MATVWWRNVFPSAWTLGIGTGAIGIWLGLWGQGTSMAVKILLGGIWAGSSLLVSLLGRSLHDVWLWQDRLIVSRGDRIVEIPLKEITAVTESRGQRLKTVKLKLRPGSPYGDEIRFVPPFRLQVPFSDHPVVREIEERKRALAGSGGAPQRLP